MTRKQTETLSFAVEGMTCNSCVARVRSALEAVSGVQAADVELRPGTARVTAAADVRMDQLSAAVEAAGYRAAPGPSASIPVIPGGSCCN
jgi:P-type Cu+ transporter